MRPITYFIVGTLCINVVYSFQILQIVFLILVPNFQVSILVPICTLIAALFDSYLSFFMEKFNVSYKDLTK